MITKNFFSRLLAVAAVCLASLFLVPSSAQAQAGLDTFAVPRVVLLTSPATLTGKTTNNGVDIKNYIGTANIVISAVTNAGDGAGTLTNFLETSPDKTNWTALANYAVATSTTVNYTNGFYGNTNLIGTNTYLLPGVITTPTAYSAGFATAYLLPAQFTNTGGLVFTGGGVKMIGVRINDQQRYIRCRWETGGLTTNYVASAILTGIRAAEVQ